MSNAATTKASKVRTAPAIPVDAADFPAKVRTALAKSVAAGVGEVRVKVADKDDRATVRKVQKRVQGIMYAAGFNANAKVTLAGDILTGRVVDLTRDLAKPGETAPTVKTPGTRQTFTGWTPAQIAAWKKAHPVGSDRGKTQKDKVTGSKSTGTKSTARKVRKVTGTKSTATASKVPAAVPAVLSGTTGTPVDTTTVTVTKA